MSQSKSGRNFKFANSSPFAVSLSGGHKGLYHVAREFSKKTTLRKLQLGVRTHP